MPMLIPVAESEFLGKEFPITSLSLGQLVILETWAMPVDTRYDTESDEIWYI